MLEEMKALKQNHTWDLVPQLQGVTPVDCRWILNIKYNANGTLERYKVRLVAKGYTQSYDIDYLETFVVVAKMTTMRVLLSLATYSGWSLQQLDVKNAFLYGDLKEEVFMEVPPRFQGRGSRAIAQIKEGTLWAQSVSKSMVWQVFQGHNRYGI